MSKNLGLIPVAGIYLRRPMCVIAVNAIDELAGIMKANGSEYLTTRYTLDSNS